MSGDDEAMVYRDQLATLIRDTVMNGEGRVDWDDIADAVIAAGWRPVVDRSAELIKNYRHEEIAPGVSVAVEDQ